jgi:DNA-binding NarL/FixJ family response regulator
MIHVFIADDHELVRVALKKILFEEFDMKVVGEATNTFELLEQMKEIKCDILILDLKMPGRSGLDIIPDLKLLNPHLRILMLSIHSEEKYALRALRAGANGYISKNVALTELVVAIRRIFAHGKYVSASLAEQLAIGICSEKPHSPHEQLSNREFEIMCMIASNMKVHEIASGLSISINTVNTYRARIFEKMNIKSNVELTHYAMDENLVD